MWSARSSLQDWRTDREAGLRGKKVQAARGVERAAELIEPRHATLSMRTQCELLGVARSSLDYEPVGESAQDVKIKRLLDEIYLCDPCLGSRKLVTLLDRDHGIEVNRKRVQRLRREMGLETIWCKPRTSIPDKAHRIYPYLLRELKVERADHVWCADITYIPMQRGSAYLCAVMDWHTRCVLGWAVSNTMDTSLCLLALERAKAKAGRAPFSPHPQPNASQFWPKNRVHLTQVTTYRRGNQVLERN